MIAERIKTVRESLSKTQKEMAELLGISISAMQIYEGGKSVPGGVVFEKLANLGYNANWLLTGKGSVKVPANLDDKRNAIEFTKTKEQAPLTSDRLCSDFDLVPMAEAYLSAGHGAFVHSEDHKELYSFRKEWLRRKASSPNNVVLMLVKGDSMAGTILDGDSVLIDAGRKHIYDGNIYALRIDDTIIIKRLSLRPGNKVQVISDNKEEYEPYTADLKDIHVIGQIIWFARELTKQD